MFNSTVSLDFEHCVFFTQDAGLFIRARERRSGYVVLFVLLGAQKPVYYRDRKVRSWQALEPEAATVVRLAAQTMISQGIPIAVKGWSIQSILAE